MRTGVAALLLVALAPTVTGCAARRAFQERVAAKKNGQGAVARPVAAATGPVASRVASSDDSLQLTDLKALPRPDGTVAPSLPVPVRSGSAETAHAASAGMPPELQYLFGSGESAGLSLQAYQALTNYLESVKYRRKETLRQLVLDDGSTLDKPYFEPCGEKPPAIVLDIDETAMLNIGYEGNSARRGLGFDDARWQRWEATGADDVIAVPGAKAALDSARKGGIAVIFNTNRNAASADQTVAALTKAGLGPAVHKTTLWMKGDAGGGSGKDVRRWAISSSYCVIAMVGDQLGDFSDLFNDPALTTPARRAAAQTPALAGLWGNGWFLLPNPVYGPGLKGGYDDLFPPATRWIDPAEEKK